MLINLLKPNDIYIYMYVYVCMYIYVYIYIYIQGITGGTDQTSGWCSLC